MKILEDITLSLPTFPQAHGTDTINIHDLRITNTEYILIEVPRYNDAMTGDEIEGYLFLGDDHSVVIKNRPYFVSPSTLHTSPYILLFPVDEISKYGAYQAKYKIISHGNERESPPTNINLIFFDSSRLSEYSPSVPEATGKQGTLLTKDDYYRLDQLKVIVPVYEGMAPGHTVRVLWKGRRNDITYEPPVQTVNKVMPMTFYIPRLEFIDTIGDTATLYFAVERTPGNVVEYSGELHLEIEGQKLNLPAPPTKYPIKVSLGDGSTVFNGQSIYLEVTIKADPSTLREISTIKIEDASNSIHQIIYKPFYIVSVGQENYGSSILLLTVDRNNSITDIPFKVVAYKIDGKSTVNNVDPLPVSYKVSKNLPQEIITLKTDNEFIRLPKTDNPITGKYYNIYEGIVNDINNNPIKNTQVIISTRRDQLSPGSEIINITHEPKVGDVNPITPITPIGKGDHRYFITLNSDENGKIKFRAYPQKGKPARIDFLASIQNLTRDTYTASMCIFPDNSQNRQLDSPFINEIEEGGILKKLLGRTHFNVEINPYDGAYGTDVLAFFTEYDGTDRKTLLSPTYRTGDIDKLEDTPFPFTYDQLEPNKLGGLYYMVISQEGEARYSQSFNVKYVQDEDSPSGNKNAVYDKVTVYSTYADFPIKPSNRSGTVSESSAVIFDLISQGLVFGEGKDNSNSAGLYVLIEAAGTSTIKNLPQPNQNGKVKVSIKSSKGLVSKEYNFDLNNLKQDGTIKYKIVTIPFCFLKGILPIDGYNPSRLYIDYYIITDPVTGEKTHSKTWKVDINTMDPNEYDDDDYYGCSS
ncbi:hypothetical protein [Xenorhabdus ishibashii]|uniref:Uncharacterized protein n=1 Tax=Xenorhabdus ishibashii TaxID=1034471 RepID=A0A2D0KKA8_9GAMM|nr:hypothetical protein [Xenorhabdus ishibashii]PHM63838.1 hypothetical protein Xish_03114 [Xenorhabdus ishibashii]